LNLEFGIEMNDAKELQYLSGYQCVAEALKQRRRPLYRLYLSREKRSEELVHLADASGVPVALSNKDQIGRLAGTGKHQGVVLECGVLPLFDLEDILMFEPPDGRDVLVLLAGVEDPRNLGAIARSCSFLGVRALLVAERGTAPLSASSSRSSAGALESLPVAVVKSAPKTCRLLAEAGHEITGLEKDGNRLSSWVPRAGKVSLVLGGEDRGLPWRVREACDSIVTIEGEGPTGSLNLSVAAGIAIHHVVRCFKSA
jgi:23S rRNA (guanosine2251-2'-O)-methyltransferase